MNNKNVEILYIHGVGTSSERGEREVKSKLRSIFDTYKIKITEEDIHIPSFRHIFIKELKRCTISNNGKCNIDHNTWNEYQTLIDLLKKDFSRNLPSNEHWLQRWVNLLDDSFRIAGLIHQQEGFSSLLSLSSKARIGTWSFLEEAFFLTNQTFRTNLAEWLVKQIEQYKPTLIIGHSLGSQILYNTFIKENIGVEKANLLKDVTILTSGSQLGNPHFQERLELNDPLEILPNRTNTHKWYNLNNQNDLVFASNKLVVNDSKNFVQLDTTFDDQLFGWTDHDPNHSFVSYFPKSILKSRYADIWKELVENSVAGNLVTAG